LANRLREGEVVGIPTETVYGLAANALDLKACRKIFLAKGRPQSDPLIVHLHHWDQLEEIAQPNEIARTLAKHFWPGPLTIILPKRAIVPDLVTAGLDSVAVRLPQHPLFQQLLERCGLPLAAPSANPFGYVSPTTAEHVRTHLGSKIAAILDGGPCRFGLESTIVDVRNPRRVHLLRPGAITCDELSKVLGTPVVSPAVAKTRSDQPQLAPGMLSRHYSPRAKVILHSKIRSAPASQPGGGEAWVYFTRPQGNMVRGGYYLTETGDQLQAAQRLFALIRELDGKGYQTLHIERAPIGPYSEAINDRLRRAAAKD